MCLGFGGRDEYRVGVARMAWNVRAKTPQSGVRGVRIKQGFVVTRRGQKGRLVSRAGLARKRLEVFQRRGLAVVHIFL